MNLMNHDELLSRQKEWAERGLLLLRDLLPLMSPVGIFPGWSSQERSTLGALLSACARSSESVLLLCAYGQVWDADVLARSVVEGTLKLMYLLQSRECFAQRHQEYAEDLFDIALLKDHKKAKALLAVVPDPDSKDWQPTREVLLPDTEVADIQRRYSQAERRALETRWGFTGLIGELERTGDPIFSGVSALCHGYAMSSHTLHADVIGVGVALERDKRSEERRELVHLSHLSRLIMDQLIYMQLRLMVGYRFVGESPESLVGLGKKIKNLDENFSSLYGKWLDVEYESG